MARQTSGSLLRDVLLASRAMQNAADALDEVVADHLHLNRTDLICLDILDRLGRITAGQLASEARLTTGAVTRVVDRLVAVGYVQREADPTDRRRVAIERTEAARSAAHEAYGPIAEEMLRSGRRFTHEQLVGILRFLELGRELNSRRAEELRQEALRR